MVLLSLVGSDEEEGPSADYTTAEPLAATAVDCRRDSLAGGSVVVAP